MHVDELAGQSHKLIHLIKDKLASYSEKIADELKIKFLISHLVNK